MKYILSLYLLIPTFVFAQDKIAFEKNYDWTQILAKAKDQDKYIFVDCYASWCVPCKRMERETFSNDTIARLVNSSFISIEVQMDSTKLDEKYKKEWYRDAHDLQERFQVFSYPTFLFFSPRGKIVHKAVGYKNVAEFSELISDALTPERQLYTVLDRYEHGEKRLSDMRYLMAMGRSNSDKLLLERISSDYVNYLSTLKESELFTRDNLQLLYQFTNSSKEKGFELFYRRSATIDSIIGVSGYSTSCVDKIIANEEVKPRLTIAKNTHKNPRWNQISRTIRRKYGKSFADRIVARSRVTWYRSEKDLGLYTKWVVISINKYASESDKDNWLYINNSAWDVFYYSNKLKELNAAAKWMGRIVQKSPEISNACDTYANILYKLGKLQQALIWEQKAIQLSSEDDDIKQNLIKMKSGKPTWYTMK